jgi:hypothetical protein
VELQLFIDRLLESENLTDNLDDEAANTLIKWGINQIDHLVKDKDDEAAGTKVNQLMSLMRAVNSIAGDPSTVSSDSLFKLLDRFAETFDKDHPISENERRTVTQQISRMQPKDAVAYLLKWMDSKL